MYLIILSNGDTHKVADDVAFGIANTSVDSDSVFCLPFSSPRRWLNPDHIVSIVPYTKGDS